MEKLGELMGTLMSILIAVPSALVFAGIVLRIADEIANY